MKFYPNSKLLQYISMTQEDKNNIIKTNNNLSEEHAERLQEFNKFTNNNKNAFFTFLEFNEVMKYPYEYSVSEWYDYFIGNNEINEENLEHHYDTFEEQKYHNIPKDYLIMYEDYTEEEKKIMEEEDKLFEGLAEQYYNYDYND